MCGSARVAHGWLVRVLVGNRWFREPVAKVQHMRVQNAALQPFVHAFLLHLELMRHMRRSWTLWTRT